ncbi:MAG TPA: GspH/FimT family pseudopilin [Desulfomonilia bacterium]
MKRIFADIKGVTLIELIIVLAIVAIGAAMAAPGMSEWMARAKLNAEARKIYSVFQLARSEAIKNNHDVCVGIVFNSDGISYSYGKSNYTVRLGTYSEYNSSTTTFLATKTVPSTMRLYMPDYPAYTGLTTWQYTSRGSFLPGDETQTLILQSKSGYKKTFTFTFGGSVTIS